MRILIIGGTRFIGRYVAQHLHNTGNEITVFHRGTTPSLLDVQQIQSGSAGDAHDHRRLKEFSQEFKKIRPDVVIDMIAFKQPDAERLIEVFAPITKRLIVISSIDVYRAFGRIHRTEPGPPDLVPLTEDSPIRERLSMHGEDAEKRWVEQVVMSQTIVPTTILRLPAVYGPNDYRLYNNIKRILDNRPAILIDERFAPWRFTHGYVENIAQGIATAATNSTGPSRIYNLGEQTTPTISQRAKDLGQVAHWPGQVITLSPAQLPKYLVEGLDWSQEWLIDSTRIRRELGYQESIPYEEGLRRTIEWQRTHPKPDLNSDEFDYAAEDRVIAEIKTRQL